VTGCWVDGIGYAVGLGVGAPTVSLQRWHDPDRLDCEHFAASLAIGVHHDEADEDWLGFSGQLQFALLDARPKAFLVQTASAFKIRKFQV